MAIGFPIPEWCKIWDLSLIATIAIAIENARIAWPKTQPTVSPKTSTISFWNRPNTIAAKSTMEVGGVGDS